METYDISAVVFCIGNLFEESFALINSFILSAAVLMAYGSFIGAAVSAVAAGVLNLILCNIIYCTMLFRVYDIENDDKRFQSLFGSAWFLHFFID